MQQKLFITNEQPTTLLADLQTFLNYFSGYSPKLTKTKQQLARKDLRALYAQLPNLGLEAKETDHQSNYPIIQLFIELSLKLQLLKKEFKGSTLSLTLNEQQLQRFNALTLTEQYVTLLQCFWTEANWKVLQGALYSSVPYGLNFLLEELAHLPIGEKLTLSRYDDLRSALHSYGHFLLYFSYFGFWDVTLDKEAQPRTIVRAKAITLKPFVQQLASVLQENFNDAIAFGDPFIYVNEEHEKLPTFMTQLQPFFEEGQLTTILQNDKAPLIHGEYLFKVLFNPNCWRTIALSDQHTLKDLHDWIQTAFDFNDDHLYAFYMDNLPFSHHCYNSPIDDDGPFVQDVTIGELRLELGQQFLYLFDFGDEWQFAVQVHAITADKTDFAAGIVAEKGEAPEQYGYDDEDDDY